jgi:hypothetical protein
MSIGHRVKLVHVCLVLWWSVDAVEKLTLLQDWLKNEIRRGEIDMSVKRKLEHQQCGFEIPPHDGGSKG